MYWSGLLLGVGSIAYIGLAAQGIVAHLCGVAVCAMGLFLALRHHRG